MIKTALAWGLPHWAAKAFGWVAPILATIAIVVGAVALIYRQGETAGGAKVQKQAEKARAKAVGEARTDERQAQTTVDAIGKRVTITDDNTTVLVRSKITEIHDDLDKTPVATAGDAASPVAAFDTAGVRASLNAIVNSANRAADAADAER